jgi:hypothetical protein
MWLMDGDGWSSRSPSLSQTSDQGTEVPEGFEAKCWPQRSAVTSVTVAVKSGPQLWDLWGSLAKVSAPESLMRLRVKSRPEISLRRIWCGAGVPRGPSVEAGYSFLMRRATLEHMIIQTQVGYNFDIIINHHCIWIIIIIIINHQYISICVSISLLGV